MHFTKTQQKAVIFIAVIFALVVAHQFIDRLLHPVQPFDFSAFDQKFHSRVDSIENLLNQEEISSRSNDATGSSAPQPAPPAGKIININSASPDELTTLPRIGPVIAERIVNYRNQNGKFVTKTDIRKVKGIGEKTYEQLENLIAVE